MGVCEGPDPVWKTVGEFQGDTPTFWVTLPSLLPIRLFFGQLPLQTQAVGSSPLPS